MNTRLRTLPTLLSSVFFTLFLGSCLSQETSTEEILQPAEEQATALPAETEQAIAEASSSDFSEPSEVQLDGGTETPVETVDNTAAPAIPDLTAESSLGVAQDSASIFFAVNSARVTKEYHDPLQDVAGKAASERTLKITLRGHCDQRGSVAFNRRLAMKRARAVKTALVHMGVRSKQITIGSAELASSGATEEEHAQNRRVEIVFP